jgi:hypothetical protein
MKADYSFPLNEQILAQSKTSEAFGKEFISPD